MTSNTTPPAAAEEPVLRYDFSHDSCCGDFRCGGCGSMQVVSDGDYVRASAYDALAARVAELEGELKAEGERVFNVVTERLRLDPNDGDADSADPADWIISAVQMANERAEDRLTESQQRVAALERERDQLVKAFAELRDRASGIMGDPDAPYDAQEVAESMHTHCVAALAAAAPDHSGGANKMVEPPATADLLLISVSEGGRAWCGEYTGGLVGHHQCRRWPSLEDRSKRCHLLLGHKGACEYVEEPITPTPGGARDV